MRIGIPREIKVLEGRVALVPAACADLAGHGHQVYVQSGAGGESGFSDEDYRRGGVEIVPDAAALYEKAELIVKVKEPQAAEWEYLRRDHVLFCYLHLAAAPELTRKLQEIGITAVAFETVEENRSLPLLAPMSIIAGTIAMQVGTHLLHRPQGGKGIMLGGLAGARRGKVVVLGAGAAGGAAVRAAAALGAQVLVCDTRWERLQTLSETIPNLTTFYPYAEHIRAEVLEADLVIGAVLITGARTPHLIDRETVENMQDGSVIADISVDQGGCVETTRPVTYAAPVYSYAGISHFTVTNMPGAVPRTASESLSAALLSYVLRLSTPQWRKDPALCAGINVDAGEIVYPALKQL